MFNLYAISSSFLCSGTPVKYDMVFLSLANFICHIF